MHTRNDSVGTPYFMDEFRTCHKFKDSKSLNQFLNSIYVKSMFPQEFENIVARKSCYSICLRQGGFYDGHI